MREFYVCGIIIVIVCTLCLEVSRFTLLQLLIHYVQYIAELQMLLKHFVVSCMVHAPLPNTNQYLF